MLAAHLAHAPHLELRVQAVEEGEIVCLAAAQLTCILGHLARICCTTFTLLQGRDGSLYLLPEDSELAARSRIWDLPTLCRGPAAAA